MHAAIQINGWDADTLKQFSLNVRSDVFPLFLLGNQKGNTEHEKSAVF